MLLAPLFPALSRSVIMPGNPLWDDARSAFNLLLDQHPAAIAVPADATRWPKRSLRPRAGLRVAPQPTGHNAGPLGDLATRCW